MNFIIRVLKRFHLIPVYRVDILYEMKRNLYKHGGLCSNFYGACANYDIAWGLDKDKIIPLFKHNAAIEYGFSKEETFYAAWWWSEGIYNTGREAFLDWLIEQYKNDKTDLRKLHLN